MGDDFCHTCFLTWLSTSTKMKKRVARAQLLIRQVQGPCLRAALIGAPHFGGRAVVVAINGAEELRVARTQPRHGGDGGYGPHGIFPSKKVENQWFPLTNAGGTHIYLKVYRGETIKSIMVGY